VIRGLGIDVVAVSRVARLAARHGDRLLVRCFATGEVRRTHDPAHLAGLLAVKEAVFKALGTGWGAGVSWRDVVVSHETTGRPQVELSGAARQRAEALGASRTLVSITHDAGVAVAVAILEGAA
jgi:holo-[acyl-carrier protein] synthase